MQCFTVASSVSLVHRVCDTAINELVEIQQANAVAKSHIDDPDTVNILDQVEDKVNLALQSIEKMCNSKFSHGVNSYHSFE
jgi:hypothetical protein